MKAETKFKRMIDNVCTVIKKKGKDVDGGMNWDWTRGYYDACEDIIEVLKSLSYEKDFEITIEI